MLFLLDVSPERGEAGACPHHYHFFPLVECSEGGFAKLSANVLRFLEEEVGDEAFGDQTGGDYDVSLCAGVGSDGEESWCH